MSEPTCRSCYAATLSKYERARFHDEPVTTSIYYCPEHQRRVDELRSALPDLNLQIRRGPMPELTFQTVADDEEFCSDCLAGTESSQHHEQCSNDDEADS